MFKDGSNKATYWKFSVKNIAKTAYELYETVRHLEDVPKYKK